MFNQAKVPNVWVITDGGLESTLQAMALGKQLAGSNQLSNTFKLKTATSSERLQMLPAILQKYLIDWSASRYRGKLSKSRKLPWYLSSKEPLLSEDDLSPDYIITSGQKAIPAGLHLSKSNTSRKTFTVHVGYPGIPFINFDQVVLPKYEANAKMAALGPLAKQKNGIITPAPLLDLFTETDQTLTKMIPESFKQNFSSVVIGGHSSICRWYSEDAVSLSNNIKRMITRLGDHVVIIFTDRTPELVKSRMTKQILEDTNTNIKSSVFIWDTTKEPATTINKLKLYENIIQHSQRVILTADLDYACAHAVSKKYSSTN
ncbi:MAG: hypothetical protein EXX96DRAFT_614939 [Benjaminiella poitrasii]|nr:MAG: hypothetical protein EXX96DRAFT_614939 [Benjaminiella poitrasii]